MSLILIRDKNHDIAIEELQRLQQHCAGRLEVRMDCFNPNFKHAHQEEERLGDLLQDLVGHFGSRVPCFAT